jgi:hypothetical protein
MLVIVISIIFYIVIIIVLCLSKLYLEPQDLERFVEVSLMVISTFFSFCLLFIDNFTNENNSNGKSYHEKKIFLAHHIKYRKKIIFFIYFASLFNMVLLSIFTLYFSYFKYKIRFVKFVLAMILLFIVQSTCMLVSILNNNIGKIKRKIEEEKMK